MIDINKPLRTKSGRPVTINESTPQMLVGYVHEGGVRNPVRWNLDGRREPCIWQHDGTLKVFLGNMALNGDGSINSMEGFTLENVPEEKPEPRNLETPPSKPFDPAKPFRTEHGQAVEGVVFSNGFIHGRTLHNGRMVSIVWTMDGKYSHGGCVGAMDGHSKMPNSKGLDLVNTAEEQPFDWRKPCKTKSGCTVEYAINAGKNTPVSYTHLTLPTKRIV